MPANAVRETRRLSAGIRSRCMATTFIDQGSSRHPTWASPAGRRDVHLGIQGQLPNLPILVIKGRATREGMRRSRRSFATARPTGAPPVLQGTAAGHVVAGSMGFE